jgi:hypothetical protein
MRHLGGHRVEQSEFAARCQIFRGMRVTSAHCEHVRCAGGKSLRIKTGRRGGTIFGYFSAITSRRRRRFAAASRRSCDSTTQAVASIKIRAVEAGSEPQRDRVAQYPFSRRAAGGLATRVR